MNPAIGVHKEEQFKHKSLIHIKVDGYIQNIQYRSDLPNNKVQYIEYHEVSLIIFTTTMYVTIYHWKSKSISK